MTTTDDIAKARIAAIEARLDRIDRHNGSLNTPPFFRNGPDGYTMICDVRFLMQELARVQGERDKLRTMLEAFGANPLVAAAIRAGWP